MPEKLEKRDTDLATTRTKQEAFSAGHSKIQARRLRRKIARRTLNDSFMRTKPVGAGQGDMESLCQRIEETIKREAANTAQQLEAFFGIQHYLAHGTLLPSFHGWPISPDIGLYLIQLIEANDYDLIIEFGPGSSTVLIAKALAQRARRKNQERPTLHVAFEHSEKYFQQTKAQLQAENLDQKVQLELTPLAPYKAPDGKTYAYYQCQDVLSHIRDTRLFPGMRVLLMVDGPPGKLGKHARYPALPIARSYLADAHLDILLDDYSREDEKEIVALWIDFLKSENFSPHMTTKNLEKGGCLITVKIQGASEQG